MKQTTLTLIIVFALTGAFGQKGNVGIASNSDTEARGISHKPYMNDISTRATRDFNSRFKKAADVRWTKIKNGYCAKFTQEDSTQVRVDYNTAGDWQNTMKYYDERKMSRNLRTQVKSRYFDYAIDLVIEIILRDKTVYEVHLSDSTSLKNIWVYDGEIFVNKEYEKRQRAN